MRGLLVALFVLVASLTRAQTRIPDVIYMKQGGAAFTMDVFTPKTSNHKAIVWMVSGGWVSSHEAINPDFAKFYTDKGFTVFEVVHGAQPRYTVPEIIQTVRRAIRFVRYSAATYGVSTTGIGVGGFSSGGHLSLEIAGLGDDGDSKAKDPVDRVSSRADAVVAYCPPTNFESWLSPGGLFPNPAVTGIYSLMGVNSQTPKATALKLFHDLSPIINIKPGFAPTLIVHGDQDALVPVQQAHEMDAALTAAKIKHKLVIVPGGGHNGKTYSGGLEAAVDWYTTHLH